MKGRPRRDLVQIAAENAGLSAPSTRGQMRITIGRLTQRKLAAADRVKVRRWANAVIRTDAELAEKVAELYAMPDLPPTQRPGAARGRA